MSKFDKLYMYKTEEVIIIIGSMLNEKVNRIYTIDRTKSDLKIIKYPKIYDSEQALCKVGMILLSFKKITIDIKSNNFKETLQEQLNNAFHCIFYGFLGII